MQFHQAENSVQLVPESVHYSGHELPQHFIRYNVHFIRYLYPIFVRNITMFTLISGIFI